MPMPEAPPPTTRARLYAALGAALVALATGTALALRQSGSLSSVDGRLLVAAFAPPALAAAGLWWYPRAPRAAGTLVVIGAGLTLGLAAVTSAAGIGLLWLPGGLLLALGAHGLLSALPRAAAPPFPGGRARSRSWLRSHSRRQPPGSV